jgi:hypothetical protein
MSFPFTQFGEDKDVPEGKIYFINPRYKWVPSETDPRVLEERLDTEATAKASLVIKNVGVPQEL